MAKEIIFPNSDSTTNEWQITPSTPISRWDKVASGVSTPDDSDYISANSVSLLQRLKFSSVSGITDADTVNSVTVRVRWNRTSSGIDRVLFDLSVGTSSSLGQALAGSIPSTIDTRDIVNVGWDIDHSEADLNDLELLLESSQGGMPLAYLVNIYEIEIEIDYTPASSGTPTSGNIDLFVQGKDNSNNDLDLFVSGKEIYNNNADLFIKGKDNISNDLDLFIQGQDNNNNDIDLFISGKEGSANNLDLLLSGRDISSNDVDLSIVGHNSLNNNVDLFIHGLDTTRPDRLFWTESNDNTRVASSDLEGSDERTIVPPLFINGGSPWGLGVDFSSRKLWWTDFADDEIGVSDIDGINPEILLTSVDGISEPKALEYAININKIYWSDHTGQNIKRSDPDGSNIETLVADLSSSILGLTIDYVNNSVYCSSGTIINKANMDLSVVEIVVSGSDEFRGLSFEKSTNKIYFVNSTQSKIERIDLDGSNREGIVTGIGSGVQDVRFTPFNGKIYWSDSFSDTIKRSNLDGTNIETILDLSDPGNTNPIEIDIKPIDMTHLFIDGKDSQNNSVNLFINGKDDQDQSIDLFIHGHQKIVGCRPKLYFTQTSPGTILRANANGNNVEILRQGAINDLVLPNAINVHSILDKIYWIDAGDRTVQRSDLDGSNHEIIITGLGGAGGAGLTVAPASGFVFWTDTTNDLIERSDLEGNNRTVIISSMIPSPRHIDSNEKQGKIYWTENNNGVVQKSNMDGSNIETVISGLMSPNGISVDPFDEKVYWTDNDIIQKSNLDGSSIETIVEGLSNTAWELAIDFIEQKLYVTDPGDPDLIHRCNFDGTQQELILPSGLFQPRGIAIDQGDVCFNLSITGKDNLNNEIDLFIGGLDDTNVDIDLFISGHDNANNNIDLTVNGKNNQNENIDLFIQGKDNTNNSIDLFIRDGNQDNNDIDLFIEGHSDDNNNIDLFVQGSIISNNNINLVIDGRDTTNNDLDLFISDGVNQVNNNVDLFLLGSGVAPVNNNLDLLINGIELIPEDICPPLDPGASIQITDTLIQIYQSRIDALINQLGKKVLLEFDPVRSPCPNCMFDQNRRRSTGIYIQGGPRPFERGRRCPWCKGEGFEVTQETKCIIALLQWNPKDSKTYGISTSKRANVIRIKTFLTELDDLSRARTAIVDYDEVETDIFRVRLIKKPLSVGLREDRYCISFWELI